MVRQGTKKKRAEEEDKFYGRMQGMPKSALQLSGVHPYIKIWIR